MALQTQETEALKTRPSIWMPVTVVIAIVAIIGIVSSARKKDIPIRATTVQRQTISSIISTNGRIEPIAGFEAHAPIQTTVKKILVREGDQVKAGQMLVQLDDAAARAEAARALAQLKAAEADLTAIRSGGTREEVITNQAELTRARAELQAAQRNLDAVKKLQQTGAASPAEVAEAESRLKTAQGQAGVLEQKTTDRFSTSDRQRTEAAVEQARASYAAAQDVLAKTNVQSPISGTVYSLPARQGYFVNPGDLLVQVADVSQLIVRAFVDEPDIGRLAKGQKVSITWDALPGRTWEGQVTQVPSTVTLRGARTVGEVTANVDNGDRKLLPNVNVSATITTAKDENALTVPREAVHQDDGRRYVLQVVDKKLKRVDVETSISTLTLIEVTRGLQDGAVVALGSLSSQPLREGALVKLPQ